MANLEDFPDLEERFRARFIESRVANGLTQQDVATALGTTQQTVARFEGGQRGLGVNDLPRWAGAIGEYWLRMLSTQGPEGLSAVEVKRLTSELNEELRDRRDIATRAERDFVRTLETEADAQQQRFDAQQAVQQAWARVRLIEARIDEIRDLANASRAAARRKEIK
jgi:transcriptional regulator with XRE-family HTH domain